MEYIEYLQDKKEFYDRFIEYINNEDDNEVAFQSFLDDINSDELEENREEFKLALLFINQIFNYHHRYPTFIHKIELFLSYYKDYIKQSFSNSELFNIFKNNKRLLYFLFKENMIIVDESITKGLPQNKPANPKFYRYYFTNVETPNQEKLPKYCIKPSSKNYMYYFFPEIKPFISKQEASRIEKNLLKMNKNIFDTFEENRQIGENESIVCKLIREDLIEEFDTYANQTNLSLSSQIPESIFETNKFIMKKRPTLIEYAAFYGSIQIFQYLRLKNVVLEPSLWIYAIHGNNPELIHLLEENNIKPENESYLDFLKESIKCHHNDIAYYILNNLMEQNIEIKENNFIDNKVSYGFHFYNYEFIQSFDNFQFIFYYACIYGYFSVVKILLKNENIDLNQKIIFSYIF